MKTTTGKVLMYDCNNSTAKHCNFSRTTVIQIRHLKLASFMYVCIFFNSEDGITPRRFDGVKQLDNERISNVILHIYNGQTYTVGFSLTFQTPYQGVLLHLALVSYQENIRLRRRMNVMTSYIL